MNDCSIRMRECMNKAVAVSRTSRSIETTRFQRFRAVCGSDNHTYKSKCHLERQQCLGFAVTLKHNGQCKDACLASKAYALEQRSKRPGSVNFQFIPRCRKDGGYSPVQCLAGSGCWCVTRRGQPIPNTSVRTGRPLCARKAKSTHRRSSSREKNNKKGCSKSDRASFNMNLIKIFLTEYQRSQSGSFTSNGNNDDQIVVDWKFSSMDSNKDGWLDKNEYRELKRLVKKIVKPRRCARTFGRACDLDHDDKLSKTEWEDCLSREGINRKLNFIYSWKDTSGSSASSSSNNHRKPSYPISGVTTVERLQPVNRGGNFPVSSTSHRPINVSPPSWSKMGPRPILDDSEEDSDDFDEEEEDFDDDVGDLGHHLPPLGGSGGPGGLGGSGGRQQVLHGSVSHPLVNTKFGGRDSNSGKGGFLREDSDSDCLSDRAAVLDEQLVAVSDPYVPECTADGRYQRVQCYGSTGYCWCVQEDSGKPIAGTSTKDKKPQCDALPTPSRPMKGCPEQKKAQFLRDLMEFLKKQMNAATNGTNIPDSLRWMAPINEQVATWHFVMFDKNKNKNLDRKEWKTFRTLISNHRNLRRCGKKLPRYCDANHDKKITLSEWLDCLKAQRTTESTVSPRPTPHSKRKGPNPLESILKSD
ncbi:SPARC-related modular calcium-binding protein 1-like [Ctenocephalides felis]|uniref:SPARC-related modular calcium-binding protein 1-like n=1 Tax=Ctenocephalides felis TaxID=7515 RepID=UPI000E6E367D|nr:SPARC-related modular calcium-binding protein 1-like [Ctenocephalides felis]